jgi:hypothetical protein
MVDSEELFYTMFKNNYMLKSSFILFFNKKDLFEDKLKYVDLKQFYPEYKGIFTISNLWSWAKVFGPDRDSNPDLLATVQEHYHCATEAYNWCPLIGKYLAVYLSTTHTVINTCVPSDRLTVQDGRRDYR